MSKIICDICGTTYPASSEVCPICGCTNAAAAELLGADVVSEDFVEETTVKAAKASANKRKKEIFDYDEVNTEHSQAEEDEDEEEDYDAEGEEEEEPRHNTFVVILLTVLIVALLGAAAFIFVRYFLPNMNKEETVPTTVATQAVQTDAPSTEPTIPCQHMAMTNAGIAELSAEGQQFLLHIKALPENTTDKIIYTSGDESIATVTEDGKITAVSEGETIIYISCGIQRIECPVIVKYVEETVPPTTAAVEEEITAPVEEETTAPVEEEAESEGEEESEEGEEPDETQEAEDEEEASEAEGSSELKDVTLKLKRKDMQLGVYYYFSLLDCDLDPEEVTWTSEHPHIAKVDEQGVVTAMKAGTTSITAKYGDQEVKCIVRCVWY